MYIIKHNVNNKCYNVHNANYEIYTFHKKEGAL